jgi:hypothetical protein
MTTPGYVTRPPDFIPPGWDRPGPILSYGVRSPSSSTLGTKLASWTHYTMNPLEPCPGDVEPVVGDERDEQRFGVSQVAASHVGPRGRSGEGDAARRRHAAGPVDERRRCPFPPVVDRVGELLADRQERVTTAMQRLVEA